MKPLCGSLRVPTMFLAASTFLAGTIEITAADEAPAFLVTPDKVDTRIIGPLESRTARPVPRLPRRSVTRWISPTPLTRT